MSGTKGDDLARRAAARTAAGGTETSARVVDVLLLFTDAPGALGVTAIARELGLSKAVVHRIVTTLVSREILAPAARRGYRLGPAAAALGARALRDSDLRRAALPVLRDLAAVTGETTTLSELIGDSRVYLDQVESGHEIKMTVEVGRRFPLTAGASSKAILAFLPAERRERLLAAPVRLTPQTVTDPALLRAELAAIRSLGAATTSGERQPGAASVAAPVFDPLGDVVGAVSVCGPAYRFDPDTCRAFVPLVLRAAERVTAGVARPHGEAGGDLDGVALTRAAR